MKNLVPVLILGIALFLFSDISSWSQAQLSLIEYFGYFTFIATGLLGFWFNRCRIFFQTTLLLISLVALLTTAKFGAPYFEICVFLISFLLPINLVIFSIMKERGIFSFWGKVKIGAILFQVYLCADFILAQNVAILELAQRNISFLSFLNFLGLPHISLVGIISSLFIGSVRLVITRKPINSALVGVLVALTLAFYFKDKTAFSLFFSSAGLILVITIIQDTYLMAYVDELTGLPGRRAFKEAMLKVGSKYSIAILDIDFFKNVNDSHGHDVGDDVLKFVAATIKTVSGGGKAFRYGGEEFMILFPGKSIKEVESHLEDLRLLIAERGFTLRRKSRPIKKPTKVSAKKRVGRKLNLTVSIGLAERNSRNKTSEEVIKAADKALYQAKNNGRNCLCK